MECFNCKEKINGTPGLAYNRGEGVKYLCEKCNKECGEFVYRRTLQEMKKEVN